MIKMKQFLIYVFLFFGISIIANGQVTEIKGKVHNWPTDTVYLATLPFHSPYSNSIDFQVLSKDSLFDFKFKEKKEPFVFFISPEKVSVSSQIKLLLYDNLTDQHYYGNCIKVYTYGITTYLVEPNNVIDIDLTLNSWTEQLSSETAEKYRTYGIQIPIDNIMLNVGKTKIEFLNPDKLGYECYQESFDLDDKCDKALEHKKDISSAIKSLVETEQKLLSVLEQAKTLISPFLYGYIKAEIEFGARKELLKYLRFDHEKYMSTLFKTDIPAEIIEIIEFDKKNINSATMISEEYNEYLEIYLNFKFSMQKGEYVVYKQFDKEKFDFAIQELPEKSRYFYLANNLLHCNNLDDNTKLYKMLIRNYPDGNLNNKLDEKFQ
jgi:hypothetical protein